MSECYINFKESREIIAPPNDIYYLEKNFYSHYEKINSDINNKIKNIDYADCADYISNLSIESEKPQVAPITPKPLITVKSIEPPQSPAVGFDSTDIKTIASSLVEAMSEPDTKTKLAGMNEQEMTAWMASKIQKPIITASQDKKGGVVFKKHEVMIATPEEIAAFERDFMT